MFPRLLFTFLLLPFTIQAQNQFRYLLGKTYAERYISLDTAFLDIKYMSLDSAAYFSRLQKLKTLAENENDEALALESRFIKANYDMVGNDYNRPRFLKNILELKEIADDRNAVHLQIRIRQMLGYYYFHIAHAYGPGFENYIAAYNLLKNVPLKEFPNKQQFIAEIGSAYYQFGDYENARKILYEAQRIPPSFRNRFTINMINTLGLIYREKRQYDSAEHFLRKAYSLAEKDKDSTWMGITAGNIGISYFLQNKFEEAVPLLEFDIKESLKANERDNAANSLIFLAKINFKNNEPDKARSQLNQALKLLSKTGDPYRLLKDIYPLQARLKAQSGNYQAAYLYADSALTVSDSLHTRHNSQALLKAEQKVAIERYKADIELVKKKEEFERLLLYGLLAAIVLISIIGFLINNRKRLLLKQTQQQLRAEKQTIELELKAAETQLSDFTRYLREKNELIEKFAAQAEQLKPQQTQQEVQNKDAVLSQLVNTTILTDKQWDEFRELFEKVHKGYLQRLREKLPDLSPAETRYMVLSKLKLSNKEMAGILGIKPDAIRLYRHRLRKKLTLPDDSALNEVVQSV